ncbi:MAG: thioredoxin [Defluviitaleaceae bacterium]|nr:thioredoxin [Defluviitaleaceae bacterium]
MVQKIGKENFEKSVNNPEKTVIVDFYADWCGPCKMLAPVLDELSAENDDIEIFKLNVDDEPDLAKRFGVSSIPTLISFKEGEELKRIKGAYPKEAILEELL